MLSGVRNSSSVGDKLGLFNSSIVISVGIGLIPIDLIGRFGQLDNWI